MTSSSNVSTTWKDVVSDDPINRLLNVQNNRRLTPNGWEHRWGIGRTAHPPDTIQEIRKPVKQCFMHFTAPNITTELNCDLRNITTIWLQKLKITGIVGAPDVLFLKFIDTVNSLEPHIIHNINSVSQNVIVIDVNGATTTNDFNEGIILVHLKSSFDFQNAKIQLFDINGDVALFTDCFLWMVIETMNWQ